MPKSKKVRHTRVLGARVSPEDYERFQSMAHSAGFSTGEFVRRVLVDYLNGGSRDSRMIAYLTVLYERVTRAALGDGLTVEEFDQIVAELRGAK